MSERKPPYVANFDSATAMAQALARFLAGRDVPPSISRAWANRQRWVVAGCAWIAQNIRFLLLALTVVPGSPAVYCWIVVGPLNAVLVFLILAHEREPKLCTAAY